MESLLSRRLFLEKTFEAVAYGALRRYVPKEILTPELADVWLTEDEPSREIFLGDVMAGGDNSFLTTYYVGRTGEYLRYADIKARLLTCVGDQTVVSGSLPLFESVLTPNSEIVDSCGVYNKVADKYVVAASIYYPGTQKKILAVQSATAAGGIGETIVLPFTDNIVRYGLSLVFLGDNYLLVYTDGRDGPDNLRVSYVMVDDDGNISGERLVGQKMAYPSVSFHPGNEQMLITMAGTPFWDYPGLNYVLLDPEGGVVQQGILNPTSGFDRQQSLLSTPDTHYIVEQTVNGANYLRIYELAGGIVNTHIIGLEGVSMSNTACLDNGNLVIAAGVAKLTYPVAEYDLNLIQCNPITHQVKLKHHGLPGQYEGCPGIVANPLYTVTVYERSPAINDPNELYAKVERHYRNYLPVIKS